MEFKLNGGSIYSIFAHGVAGAEISSVTDTKIIYQRDNLEAVLAGEGFSTTGSGAMASAGTVHSITLKIDGEVYARGTDLMWSLSELLSEIKRMEEAIEASEAYDPSGLSALLSDGPLEVNGIGASQGIRLLEGMTYDGEVTFKGSSNSDIVFVDAGDDKLFGRGNRDYLAGGEGNDRIDGGGDADILHGNEGNDKIIGRGGDDEMFGGADADDIDGGSGADIINGDEGNDILSGGKGRDTIDGGAGDDQIDGDGGHDKLYGGADNDIIRGGSGKDRIEGGDGNDILGGNSGKDTIKGGAGNDFIVGGSGKDVLYGGTEADQFIFNHAKDSGKGKFSDTIMDFEQGVDFLDFSAFGTEFIGDAKFSGTGAEVQATNDGSGNSILIVDVNGDGKGDMRIDVMGVEDLMADSFVTLDPA
ncbi:hypothetical protein C0U40_03290 [Amylibacter cionae]|nr:hypothetical protein C0U40_03290 [Amylibacter cionae]